MPKCRHASTDVDLGALLFGGSIRAQDLGAKLHPSVQQAFLINGKMDANLAYWIRIVNTLNEKHPSLTEAGVLSRAKKATYNTETWSIVKLNYTMFLYMPETWKDLPNHPQCPPAPKDELLNKTSP